MSFRRYGRLTVEVGKTPKWYSVDSLCAFVVRPGANGKGELARVELGPIAAIDAAVQAWRDAIGVERERGAAPTDDVQKKVRAHGSALRALILDPLAPALSGATRWIVALDDVLHTVPLDALPDGDSGEPLGARVRIELRASLFERLLGELPLQEGGKLVAFGPVTFNSAGASASALLETEEGDAALAAEPAVAASRGILRGGAWERGFSPLPATLEEIRSIGLCFEEAFEAFLPTAPADAPILLERRAASRKALIELAPQARFLHVATHGWFAPESIASCEDLEPLDAKSGLAPRMSDEERVCGMSPMLLCGIALAGANLPMDAVGRIPGLLTAEELATLDLSNCELAVLSACDTNVGIRRASQGVASLQRALHMAGARSAITSVWKVPDDATRELMADFYRRLWIERKPKAQALWEAKTKLRTAKDETGRPRYGVRDWAGWVLTGDPD